MADDATRPIAGEPDGGRTILEVLEELRSTGFEGDMFVTADALVRCGSCHRDNPPADLVLHQLRRLEGVSDPGEEAAVLGLECGFCGARGTAVVRFGPEAGAQDASVLAAVADRRR